MAKRKKHLKKRQIEEPRDGQRLRGHIKSLGLKSREDYQAWCRNRGLSTGLYKSAFQRKKEKETAKRSRADVMLARTRQYTRSPKNTIMQLYNREVPKGKLGAGYLRRIRSLFGQFEQDGRARRTLLDLLLQVERCADLFDLEPAIPHLGKVANNTFVASLGVLARYHEQWIRPIEDWTPDSHNQRRQFSSLVRFLFAKYDVPIFLDEVWFAGDTEEARQMQGWFLHVGAGGNIRTADISVRLTKMMAHRFLEAPDDMPVKKALRWAQVVGQGGSDALAEAIRFSRLSGNFEHEDFWETVIMFLVNNPMLDPDQVGPLIDFIHNQKYEPREIIHPGGAIEMGDPPQPSFAMKGRSVDKLLRQIAEWHEQLAQEADALEGHKGRKGHVVTWPSSGIGELRVTEDTGKFEPQVWTVRELLSNRELGAEGKVMHHCVSSYARNCRRGKTSVFTLRVKEESGDVQPVLTIAVDARDRSVTQVRGKYNMSLSGKVRSNKHRSLSERYRRLLKRGERYLQLWMRREELRKAF